MTDVFDRASELEIKQRELAIDRQKEHSRLAATSAYECEECGEHIPEARRQAVIGCRCCIDCQKVIEKYGKTRFA